MIKKHVLTAALLTAVLLLTGCLMEGGPVIPTEPAQMLPDLTETETPAREQTYPSPVEILPIPPDWGEETTSEKAAEPTLPVETAEAESQKESETDSEGESTTKVTTTAPGRPQPEPAWEREEIALDPAWEFADEARIVSGKAVLYRAKENRKNIVVGVNAGHGTEGGQSAETYCHPDHTPKVTGGTTAEGSLKAVAVSSGMSFPDGTPERAMTLKTAEYLRTLLLNAGYDVLMLRDGEDVQLDNVARTVIANRHADCHIAIHWDDDGYDFDKGAYFLAVPEELESMYPVSEHWREHEKLGWALIKGCRQTGYPVWNTGDSDMDLTQTSYSTVPSVDIEMGNEHSKTDDAACLKAAEALFAGIGVYFADRQN